jgi:hypothetical protein
MAQAATRPIAVIPGRATDLGFTRDRHSMVPKSAKADFGGASPESTVSIVNEFGRLSKVGLI